MLRRGAHASNEPSSAALCRNFSAVLGELVKRELDRQQTYQTKPCCVNYGCGMRTGAPCGERLAQVDALAMHNV